MIGVVSGVLLLLSNNSTVQQQITSVSSLGMFLSQIMWMPVCGQMSATLQMDSSSGGRSLKKGEQQRQWRPSNHDVRFRKQLADVVC